MLRSAAQIEILLIVFIENMRFGLGVTNAKSKQHGEENVSSHEKRKRTVIYDSMHMMVAASRVDIALRETGTTSRLDETRRRSGTRCRHGMFRALHRMNHLCRKEPGIAK